MSRVDGDGAPPIEIRIEMFVLALIFTILPLWAGWSFRRGGGIWVVYATLFALAPLILGEIALLLVLLVLNNVRDLLPWAYAIFNLVHVAVYGFAWRDLIQLRRAGRAVTAGTSGVTI
jgi:hypothetical protein